MTNSTPHSSHGACLLPHWGLIRAEGPDARSFLHGQLTNDVLHLASDEARIAGYCSAKGRLLANFILWLDSQDVVLLACHQSVLAATIKRLSMYVLRAKCKLTDASSERPIWGVCGDSAMAQAGALVPWKIDKSASSTTIRLPDVEHHARALWVGHGASDRPIEPELPLQAWRHLEVASGYPVIEAATADQLVPQMLNYELIGGINFQKGCYPGQEVVARSQYRGTAKRRTFLFESISAAAPGTEVFHSDDPAQPAGLVVNSAQQMNTAGHSFLIEVKLAALGHGELRLSSVDGPLLRQKNLPYPVPLAEDGPAS